MFALRVHPSVIRIHPTMATRALSRLNLFKDHLQLQTHTLNTPFSTERSSQYITERDVLPEQSRFYSTARSITEEKEAAPKMSNQEPHAALLIPGPIEFDDAVLQAMSHFRYASQCRSIDSID
jgi:alanine-glyoxylate transaminase/serine-glyoxylate transaminase/serine-pyruvate transaminase